MARKKAQPVEVGDVEIDLEILREDLILVLQAINQLEEHRDLMVNYEAHEALASIIGKEKQNFTLLTQLIQKLENSIVKK